MTVIFFGPLPEPITGQSISFALTYENYKGNKKVFDYSSKENGLLSLLVVNIKVVFLFLLYMFFNGKHISVVYLTTSRSTLGFLRDSLVVIVSSFLNVKIVNHLHGADFKSFRSRQSRALTHFVDFVYNKIDTSIVLLPKMKEQYDMYPKMNVEVISNCFTPIKYDVKPKDFSSKTITLLYLSNIMYSKGVIHTLDAVSALNKGGFDIKLHVAGSAMSDEYYSDQDIFHEFIDRVNLSDKVVYHGVVSGKEKHQLLLESDIFILPSFYPTEAQPISIIEAMAYGCPIICTDHNYLSDMIDESNGFVIKKQSTDAIKLAIKNIYNNRDALKQMSSHNINYARKFYSSEHYLSRVFSLISED